jgi:hypothetical protein
MRSNASPELGVAMMAPAPANSPAMAAALIQVVILFVFMVCFSSRSGQQLSPTTPRVAQPTEKMVKPPIRIC